MTREDDILYEIDELKKELDEVKEQQESILEEERMIRNETQAVLAEERNVEGRLTKMKYSDITRWRNAIWENCKFKESRAGERAISYWCTKMDAPCRFEDCPLNQY